jgi:hypothetical protein
MNDSKGWQADPDGYILPVMFHELSHIYGTLDDPGSLGGRLSAHMSALNATEFQGLYSLGLDSTYYENLKGMAQFRCERKDLSSEGFDIVWRTLLSKRSGQ